jgi:small-conductance mechanosensitive channel
MVDRSAVRCWAGFASLGAALIHFAVVQEHLEEWWLYGVFFAALATVQLLWAGLTLTEEELPAPRLFAAVNAVVLVLWLVTRTTGLPVGPQPWEAEPVGIADVMCGALELVVVVLLVLSVRRSPVEESATTSWLQGGLVAIGALAVASVTIVGLAATGYPENTHHHATPGASVRTLVPAPASGRRVHHPQAGPDEETRRAASLLALGRPV